MSADEFQTLFKYMSERFDTIERKLDEKADAIAIDRVFSVLDDMRGLLDTDELERGALMLQVDRHENWVVRTSPKVEVSYDQSA